MHSGLLSDNEYAPFYGAYITSLGDVDLRSVLKSSLKDFKTTIKKLPKEKLTYQYAENKWTIKELIQHIIDTERILSYRALRFSRNDATDLPGFDEDWYVENSNGNIRPINELIEEFKQVRKATLSLFKSFSPEMLEKTGSANGSDMTVRALGFIIAGHQIHHLKVIKEKYI